jgi:hypothetical protein
MQCLNLHHWAYRHLPLVPNISQSNHIHMVTLPISLRPAVVLSCHLSLGLTNGLLTFKFFACISHLSHACYMHRPSCHMQMGCRNVRQRVQIRKLITTTPYSISSLLGPNIPLSTMFSNVNLCSPLPARHQVSYPHKEAVRILRNHFEIQEDKTFMN